MAACCKISLTATPSILTYEYACVTVGLRLPSRSLNYICDTEIALFANNSMTRVSVNNVTQTKLMASTARLCNVRKVFFDPWIVTIGRLGRGVGASGGDDNVYKGGACRWQ